MHYDILKIQDGVALSENLNCKISFTSQGSAVIGYGCCGYTTAYRYYKERQVDRKKRKAIRW